MNAPAVSLLRPSTGVRPLVGIAGARIHAAEIASDGILLHAFTDASYAMDPTAVERAGGQPVQVPRENDPATIAGEEIEHAVVLYPPDARVHEVRLSDGSLLREICGETVSVNSFHRQGIGDLGAGVRATRRGPDGVIAGIEVAGARAVGVQWHPEMLSEIDPLLIWLIDQASASESSATLQKGPYGGHSA